MARKKKKKTNNVGTIIVVIVLPLLLVNIWAGWKIFRVAEALEIPLLGSVHDGPIQLAALLLINSIVITLLTVLREK
jgi:hypothetical protein